MIVVNNIADDFRCAVLVAYKKVSMFYKIGAAKDSAKFT